jgi:7,8-dihydro-6-hydroxymethylpterin-pyrophosphokinase
VTHASQVYVAAGSNVAPLENLRRALDVLDSHFAPLAVSRAYANAAVGFEGGENGVDAVERGHPLRHLVGLAASLLVALLAFFMLVHDDESVDS